MQYTFGGLVLATIFGMFFGSEGEMDPPRFAKIFWGLIGSGMLLHLFVILKDTLCRKRHTGIAGRSRVFQRFLHC